MWRRKQESQEEWVGYVREKEGRWFSGGCDRDFITSWACSWFVCEGDLLTGPSERLPPVSVPKATRTTCPCLLVSPTSQPHVQTWAFKSGHQQCVLLCMLYAVSVLSALPRTVDWLAAPLCSSLQCGLGIQLDYLALYSVLPIFTPYFSFFSKIPVCVSPVNLSVFMLLPRIHVILCFLDWKSFFRL